MLVTTTFSFFHNVFYCPNLNFNFWVTFFFFFSSANTSTWTSLKLCCLVKSKVLITEKKIVYGQENHMHVPLLGCKSLILSDNSMSKRCRNTCSLLNGLPSCQSCSIMLSMKTGLLTLSQTTNFSLFQTEIVCRRQFLILWKWKKVLQKVRKHCGKRRNCSLRAISPFPTVFSKALYCRHVKTRACLGKG